MRNQCSDGILTRKGELFKTPKIKTTLSGGNVERLPEKRRYVMAKQTIQSIEEAEAKAGEIIKKAEAEKTGIINQAKAESAAYAQDLIAGANKAAAKALAEVEGRKDAELEKAQVRAEAVIAQHQEASDARKKEAVDLVISEIAF